MLWWIRQGTSARGLVLAALVAMMLAASLPGSSPCRADSTPEQVIQAGSLGLQRFLGAIPPEDLNRFGFSNESELARAELAPPIPLAKLLPEAVLGTSGDVPAHDLITPTETWLLPVVCDGHARAILTVDLFAGEWRAVDLGAAELASEYESLARAWSVPWTGFRPPARAGDDSLARPPAAAAKNVTWLRCNQAGCNFLLVAGEGTWHLVPFRQTARALAWITANTPYAYPEVTTATALAALAPLVRANLTSGAVSP